VLIRSVRVSDVGRLPSGAPYLVMEYLEGEDLAQRLERGRVPIEDALEHVYLHTIIHVSVNKVPWRFGSFLATVIALLRAWVHFAIVVSSRS
jgi:hypothetical protein